MDGPASTVPRHRTRSTGGWRVIRAIRTYALTSSGDRPTLARPSAASWWWSCSGSRCCCGSSRRRSRRRSRRWRRPRS